MKGIRLAEKDFLNGVKVIRDKNYNPNCNGVTKQSLLFFHSLLKKGFFSADEVYRADLTYHKKHWYKLTLFTLDGYEFHFYGCSFGYGGEGSRGSKAILDICGFSNTDRVFQHRKHFESPDQIRFFKRVKKSA